MIICSGRSSQYLAERIANELGLELGKVSVILFTDGEFQTSFDENIRDEDVYIIQSTFSPSENLFELLFMIDAAKRASAKNIIAVIPYFGYARSNHKSNGRTPIAAKLIANMLTVSGVSRIITMDLDTDQIQGFFDIPVDHLYASVFFIPYIKTIDNSNIIFISADVYDARRIKSYAEYLGTSFAVHYYNNLKRTILGDVEGKDAVIVSDLIDSGKTICDCANYLLSKGAGSARAFCTHAILTGSAYELIEKSQIEEVYITDTIPLRQSSEKIKVISTASLFAEVIRRISSQSISSLYKFKTNE